MKYLIILLACLLFPSCAAHLPEQQQQQQQQHTTALPPPPLMQGIGRGHIPITTDSPLAQQYFDQGLALAHGYWYYEAWRAFRHAARLDSTCAMTHWGIYQALSGSSPARRNALKRASRLSPNATDREQRYIRAAVLLDSLGHGTGRQLFIQTMRELIARYPDDVEAKLFLIRFLMPGYDPDAPPRQGEPDPQQMLRELLVTHPDHAAVHHYWIHVIEPGARPRQALTSAKRLPELAPQAGHLVHMPGHIHYLLGDYEKARDAFLAAHAVDSTYMARQKIPPANTWNYIHNLNFLVTNCAEDGRYREGVRWAEKLAKIPLDRGRAIIFYQARIARARLDLRYGFWQQAAASLEPLVASDTLSTTFARHYAEALLAHARGMAALEEGQLDAAQKHAGVLKNFTWLFTVQQPDPGDPYYSQRRLDFIDVLSRDLQGNIHSYSGDHQLAIQALTEARKAEAALGYEEPPAAVRPVLESIGAAHRRADAGQKALEAYAQLLEKRPRSGHALLGIARVHARAGQIQEARAAYQEFLATWSHADDDLPQIQQARTWLADHPD